MSHFDKHFRDQLHNREVEVPEHLWDKIDKRVNEKHPRLRLYVASALMVLGMMLIVPSIIFVNIEEQRRQQQAEASSSVQIAERFVVEPQIGPEVNTEATSNHVTNMQQSSVAARSVAQPSDDNPNVPMVSTESATAHTISTVASESDEYEASQSEFNSRRTENSSPMVMADNNIETAKFIITKSYLDKEVTISQSEITIKNNDTPLGEMLQKRHEKKEAVRLQELKEAERAVEIDATVDFDEAVMLPPSKVYCPAFAKNKLGLFVDLYASHDLPFQSLSASGATNEMYLAARQATESINYSTSLGFKFGITFPSGFGLKTGFNYSKINSTFRFNDADAVMMEGDSTMVEVPGMRNVINNNSISTFDVPVLLSYEFEGPGRFYYGVNAGFLFNIVASQKGKFLNSNQEVVDFSSGSGDKFLAYKNSIGSTFYSSFAVHYILNDMFDLTVEPNFRTQLSSITRTDYEIDERFTTLGLITGLRYKF